MGDPVFVFGEGWFCRVTRRKLGPKFEIIGPGGVTCGRDIHDAERQVVIQEGWVGQLSDRQFARVRAWAHEVVMVRARSPAVVEALQRRLAEAGLL